MDPALQIESERLVRSWQRHDAAMLRDYLVADVEDPRLNVQSILSRHFLAHAVFGDRFQGLMDAELRFAAAMNWLLATARDGGTGEDFQAIAAALRSGADNAEGIAVPMFLRRLARELPMVIATGAVPDYLGAGVGEFGAAAAGGPVPGVLDTFVRLWQTALAGHDVEGRIRVLEPACGSANDYRLLDAAGLVRFLDYTGFDLCEQNVANARALFPGARFGVGNVFDIGMPDRTYDYLFLHDLFEHLSPTGLEQAVAEVCRVARSGLCLGFFQMDETDEHVIRPVEEYHFNTLSLTRTLDLFGRHGFVGEAVHVGSFMRWRFGCEQTHNPNAYTLILGRAG
jgi:SAM-dependent methyltransferase